MIQITQIALMISCLSLVTMACTDSTSGEAERSDAQSSSLRDLGLPPAGEMISGEMIAGERAGEMTAGERAGEMTAGEMTAGEVTSGDMSAGEASAGEVSAGEVMAGDMSQGGMTAGEVPAGDEMNIADCEAQMSCLVSCDVNDFACRQACVLEGRAIDQGALDEARSCLDRSGCQSATCAFSSCEVSLLACEDAQGMVSCADTQGCLASCGEDAGCVLSCIYYADMSAESAINTWSTCLLSRGCERFGCDECGFSELCMGDTSDQITLCSDVLNCMSMCTSNDPACIEACVMRSTPEALQPFYALIQCVEVNMCGSSQECITANCNDALLACATNQDLEMPNTEIITCMDLNGCLEECPDSDNACKQGCLNRSPQDALDVFNDLRECSDTHMCNQDVTCLSTNCQQELVACVSDQ